MTGAVPHKGGQNLSIWSKVERLGRGGEAGLLPPGQTAMGEGGSWHGVCFVGEG